MSELSDILASLINPSISNSKENDIVNTPTDITAGSKDQSGLMNINSKEYRSKVHQILAEAAGQRSYTPDQGVAFHTDPPNRISIPVGTTTAAAAKRLAEVAADEEQVKMFTRIFNYRPWDGAYAMMKVMEEVFGTTGKAMPQMGFFGPQPPQMINVDIDYGVTAPVAWGTIEFSILDGKIHTGTTHDPEYGMLFQLSVEAPQKVEMLINGFFALIENYLKHFSIYKGKPVETVVDRNGVDAMKFLNLTPDNTIVYNKDVEAKLRLAIWDIIENADLVKSDNKHVNRRVLLWGPYGTGKSEAGKKTGSICKEEGWTYFLFRSGEGTLDDLEKVIKTARLYQPAVVMIEDSDVYTSNDDPNYLTRLSNLFDGIQSKDDEVMLLMTSNRPAEFSKAMLRAGRLDAMIELPALDREATEELVRRVVGVDRLSANIDWDAVWKAMEDFEPAFVRKAFDQAAEAALLRNKSRSYILDTEDFVVAADLLRPQHDAHRNKSDERKDHSLEDVLGSALIKALSKHTRLDIELGGDYDLSGSGEYKILEIANA